MKKILLVEHSIVIVMGLIQILKEIGFDESSVDATSSFDGMLEMVGLKDYALLLFGLGTGREKHLGPLLEVAKKKTATIFLVFDETLEIGTQRLMHQGGIKGILNKTAGRKEIIFAIQKVLDNEIYMDTASSIKLLYSGEAKKKTYPLLTIREEQVAELLVQGKNNLQICNILNIMPSTVSSFKKRIFAKLGVQNIFGLMERGNNK